MNEPCPCGSAVAFANCCGVLLAGKRKAATAEELMRSRYSAYVKQDVDYLVRTTWPAARAPNLAADIRRWMKQVEWVRLHVLAATADRVEFLAEYVAEGKPAQLHERSLFKKHKDAWFYVAAE